jgi:hypothetical protein
MTGGEDDIDLAAAREVLADHTTEPWMIDIDYVRTHAAEMLTQFGATVKRDEDGDWGILWPHGGWTLGGGRMEPWRAECMGAMFCYLWLSGVSLPLVAELARKAFL